MLAGGQLGIGLFAPTHPPHAHACSQRNQCRCGCLLAVFCRVEGLKRAAAVAVGEKHSLALQRWSAAQLPGLQHVPWLAAPAAAHHGGEGMLEEEAAYQRAADSIALGTPRGSDLESEASGLESVLSSPERCAVLRCTARPARCAWAQLVTQQSPLCTAGGDTAAAKILQPSSGAYVPPRKAESNPPVVTAALPQAGVSLPAGSPPPAGAGGPGRALPAAHL